MTNHYEVLGVGRSATSQEIKGVYRKLVLRWHPDKFGQPNHLAKTREEAEEKFKEISSAYRIVSDPETRKTYDVYGNQWESKFTEKRSGREEKVQDEIRLSISSMIYEFRSHWTVSEEDLDPSLWNPYESWQEKFRSLTELNEVKSFYSKLIAAIKEKEEDKENDRRKKEAIWRIKAKLNRNKINPKDLKEEYQNYEEEIRNISKEDVHWKINDFEEKLRENVDEIIIVLQERTRVISSIKEKLSEKDLKIDDLPEKYRNYQDWINSLSKVEEIRAFEEEVNQFAKLTKRPNWWGQGMTIFFVVLLLVIIISLLVGKIYYHRKRRES